jgi:hypothetical protein
MELTDGGLIYKEELDAILTSDLPEMAKLAAAFEGLTGFIIQCTDREIELARALGDREETIKQQIKRDTLRHARGIFQACYRGVTGRKAWDEPDAR